MDAERIDQGTARRRRRVAALLPCLALLSVQVLSAQVRDKKNVLILNSYHQGFEWTDDLVRGIRSVFDAEPYEVEFWVEYLDATRIVGEENLKKVERLLGQKYRGRKLDLVISTDDAALDALLEEHPALFPGVPVVFCGVNNLDRSRFEGRKLFTGVFELFGTETILDFALRFHPRTRRVYVVSEKSPAAEAQRSAMADALRRRPQIEAVFLDGASYTLDEVVKELGQAPAESLVVMTSFRRDKTGVYLMPRDTHARLAEATPAPVYSPSISTLGQGIVGGNANGGFRHGVMAAKMAAEILRGAAPSSIPFASDDKNQLVFDFEQLRKRGIAESQLPPDSIIVNRPDSFYERNKFRIWSVIALAAVETVIIVALIMNIARRRRMAGELSKSRQFLNAIVNNDSAVIFVKDREGRYLLVNRQFESRSSLKEADLLSKTDRDFLPRETADALRVNDLRVLSEGRPIELEETVPEVDGDHTFISLKFPLFDSDGVPYAVCGIATDITDRKRAEEALRQSEERYRAFVLNSAEAILRIEFDKPVPVDLSEDEQIDWSYRHGYVGECNDIAAKVRGFPDAASLIGRRVEEFRNRRDPVNEEHDRLFLRSGYRLSDQIAHTRDREGRTLCMLNNMIGIIDRGRLVRIWIAQRDITERKQTEDMLYNLARGVSGATGEAFFRLLVAHLAKALWGDVAFVGELIPGSGRVRTVAVFSDGREATNFEYDLAGSPCEHVVGRSLCVYPMGVQQQFPLDAALARMGVEGYVGAPLFDSEGQALGLISVLFRRPIDQPELARHALEVFAARAATEMERTRTVEELIASRESLEALSAHQESVREEERTRIAREIHDELGQQLTGFKIQLSRLRNKVSKLPDAAVGPLLGEFTEASSQVDSTIESVRRIATELRPSVLDTFGLSAAIGWQAEEFQRQTGIRCSSGEIEELSVPATLSTAAFRILQEALTNVARHAHASEVKVKLLREDLELVLVVEDNGSGITPQRARASDSLGLSGMRERARIAGGKLDIRGLAKRGTRVTARFPFPSQPVGLSSSSTPSAAS